MNNENLLLSNTSYTNKDFFDAYPELLELAKNLSYKWDPTVSNESDPGVVLIKELALAIDKINYSSDKNALECMPLSITQSQNARALYNLLGYYPKWYRSAETNIVCGWSGDKSSTTHIIIPAFTQIADADSNYIYTTTSDIDMKMDGTLTNVTYEAIEGTCNTLSVNGVSNITLQMLDSNNRLYFEEYNVAYNGIFVKSSNYSDYWTLVDNINLSNLKDTDEPYIYSFNVDLVANQCYLQFPDNINELIGDGLTVKYILSSGSDGNIAIQSLSKFSSSSLTVYKYDVLENSITEKSEDTIETENIAITNTSNLALGEDPKTMDEMYNTWKYMAGTFDTLVTIRDYNNAIKQLSDYCSNGYCCDRTNDIQDSYKVFVGTDTASHYDYIIEKDDDDKDLMSAFDLKLYCTHRYVSDEISKYKFYNQTFQLYEDVDVSQYSELDGYYKIIEQLSDYKCISHDYLDLEPNKICMLKNLYTVNIKITPNYKLNSTEQADLKNTICKQLYAKFRCENMEFGQEVDTDDLYSVILDADSRIRYLYLEKPDYTTYAVYFDGDYTWHEIPIAGSIVSSSYNYRYPYSTTDTLTEDEITIRKKFRLEILSKSILAGTTPYIVSNSTTNDYEKYNSYNYYINSTCLLDQQNCKTLKTGVSYNISIGNSDILEGSEKLNEVTVSENEVIQYYKPNLMDYLSYGTYINYEFNGPIVHLDSPYELQSGEFLITFYKEADTDAKYKVELWGQGTIVLPTFELIPDKTVAYQLYNKCFSGKSIPTDGNVISSYYQFDDVSNYNCLSGSLEIEIKKINDKYIGGERLDYIYFITNDSYQEDETDENSPTYYNLTLSSSKARVLNENEYFIYTNSTKTVLEIFGSGTRLQYVPLDSEESITWTVKLVELTDIMKYGLTAIDDYCIGITDPVLVHITEQAFNNAVDGDVLNTAFDTNVIDNTSELDVTLNENGYVFNHIKTDVICTDADNTPKGFSWKDESATTITGTLVASYDNSYKVYLTISHENSSTVNNYYVCVNSRFLDNTSLQYTTQYEWGNYWANSLYLYKFTSLNETYTYIFNNNDYIIKSLINNLLDSSLDISDELYFYHHYFEFTITPMDESPLNIYIYSENFQYKHSTECFVDTVKGIWEVKDVNSNSAYFIQNGYNDGESLYHTLYDDMKICVLRNTDTEEDVIYGIYDSGTQLVIRLGVSDEALTFGGLYDYLENINYFTSNNQPKSSNEDDITISVQFPEILKVMYEKTQGKHEYNRCLKYNTIYIGEYSTVGYINFDIQNHESPIYSDEEIQFCMTATLQQSTESIPLANLNIKINDESIKSSISSSLSYTAETFLNLSTSSNEPQKLKSNQSITIDNQTISDQDCYVYSSDDLIVEGSNTTVKLELEDTNGKTYYPDFYIYSLVDSELNTSKYPYAVTSTYGSNIQIYLSRILTETSGTYTATVYKGLKFSQGNYILKLLNVNTNLSSLTLNLEADGVNTSKTISSFNLYDDAGKPLTNLNEAKTYYVEFSIDYTEAAYTWNLIVSYVKSDENVVDKVVLYPMKKYKIFKLETSIDDDDLKSAVVERDKNESFNYLYTIEANDAIINPLNASSFNESNHIYNKFTICEAFPPSIKV